MKTATENEKNEKKMMTLLFKQRESEVIITKKFNKTKKMMKITTKNEKNEKKMMTFLFEQRETNVMITKKMMKTIATCEQNEILKIIEKNFKISFF